MTDPTWIVMPIAGAQEYTDTAIADVLAQSVPVRLLLINQGVDTEFRRHLERIAESHEEDVFLWSADPPLPSLAATWNRALRFVWETGGTEAFVFNNDLRLSRFYCERLIDAMKATQALFVSGIGVDEDGWNLALANEAAVFAQINAIDPPLHGQKGGPDFSSFLISKECHEILRFDENFIPAFCEDLCYHRELLLAGLGDRIFSIAMPYRHFSSQTLKTMAPQKRASVERQINEWSRVYYRKCWGGDVNQETYTIKGDPESAQPNVTTPELQRGYVRDGGLRDAAYSATPSSTSRD